MDSEFEEKPTKKEEVGCGIAAAVMIFSLIVLVLFAWGPIGHYLEKWNDYWDDKDYQGISASISLMSQEDQDRRAAYFRADADCTERAEKYFGTSKLYSGASSTSAGYATYDCYAIKYTKIP